VKYQPARRLRDIDRIDVADVLSVYLDDCGGRQADQTELERRIGKLNDYWGGKALTSVNAASCREYVAKRGSVSGARRELEDLRAAINHHAKEQLHSGVVRVTLPPKSGPRDRWLTRSEAAKLLWACWRYRETQTIHRGGRKGDVTPTDRRPLRHVARFILLGLYTGTRASAIAAASPYAASGRSYVDLERGVFYRLQKGRRETKKRQPPAPLPPRLLAHMQRWVRRDLVTTHFVEWNGQPVKSVKKGFRHAVELAGLEGKITPHTLRHTAATWLMQVGVDLWQAAGYLGMSAEVLDRIYGHHHPDHLQQAARAIGYRPQQPVSLVDSLAGTNARSR
jgi:integrase